MQEVEKLLGEAQIQNTNKINESERSEILKNAIAVPVPEDDIDDGSDESYRLPPFDAQICVLEKLAEKEKELDADAKQFLEIFAQ